MTSIRLTRGTRHAILCRLMDHVFGKRQEQLAADERSLGDDVYEDIYPTSLQERMLDFPDGFFRRTDSIAVLFGVERAFLHLSTTRLTAYAHGSHEGAKSYDAGHPLSIRYFDIDKRRQVLSEERNRAKREVKAALDACATVRSLQEAWPEAAPFVKDFAEFKSVIDLPVPIKDLNSRLGLAGSQGKVEK